MTFSDLSPRFRQRWFRRRVDPDLQAPEPDRARRRGLDQRHSARLLDSVQGAVGDLLSLLVPAACVCCEVEDTVLCGGCAQRVRQLCKQPFRAEEESPALVDVNGTATVWVVAAGPYRDELARCLLSFKHLGQWRLAGVLAPCLNKAVEAAIGGRPGYCLVPVPTSGRAYRERGFSPVHLLLLCMQLRRMQPQCPSLDVLEKTADPFLNRLGPGALRQLMAWLVVVGLGRSVDGLGGGQKGLGRGERASRVRGSMRVRRRRTEEIKGRRCILVDDVVTTGATLAEAARAVTAAGGVVCGAVVLAATRPPAYASKGPGHEPHEVLKTQSKNKWLRDE